MKYDKVLNAQGYLKSSCLKGANLILETNMTGSLLNNMW